MRPTRQRVTAHLSEDTLLSTLFPGDAGVAPLLPQEVEHLKGCPSCAARVEAFRTLVDDIAAAHHDVFDSAFPRQRLATQRAHIMNRLAPGAGRPEPEAHLLSFPPTIGRRPRPVWSAVGRWLGGAAAAGVVLGLSIGPLWDAGPKAPAVGTVSYSSASMGAADEAFMDEVELVLSSPQVPELAALDAVTPQERDVIVTFW